jgi:hypothetical protein
MTGFFLAWVLQPVLGLISIFASFAFSVGIVWSMDFVGSQFRKRLARRLRLRRRRYTS